MSDLGDLHYFLGFEVKKMSDGILRTQEKYATEILARVDMTKCKPKNKSLATSETLSRFEGSPLSSDDSTTYRSIVGAL